MFIIHRLTVLNPPFIQKRLLPLAATYAPKIMKRNAFLPGQSDGIVSGSNTYDYEDPISINEVNSQQYPQVAFFIRFREFSDKKI